jgi:hypothetical protein
MRLFIIVPLAITAFVATLTVQTTGANAVVCARGVVRAGCVGPNGAAVVHRGAAVVHRPVAACPYVIVNGVRVRRCL